MDQDKRKSEQPAESRDVPKATSETLSDIGQKGGDASKPEQAGEQRSDVDNIPSGQNTNQDKKKDELK